VTALEAKDLTCGYERREVLRSLSLSARAGEMLVLLGPNGAGKTTLLRALARTLRPIRGAVLLDEYDIWRRGAGEFARRVALMPQNERRDWPLTVEESVRLGRAPHRGWLLPYTAEDDRIVAAALEATGLVELRQRAITELSGGEWRRTIFARALAQEASALLLDEPTAGLDLKFQHEILSLAKRLATRRRLTVVLTLHDINHAALHGDRLAFIAEQTVVALGTPPEVVTEAMIHRVFGVHAAVLPHPVYQTPMVVPLIDGSSSTPEVKRR
jgi:iron complex transport system ATP-binding protein